MDKKREVKIGGEKMRRQKTHEEYVSEVAIKNPNIQVVGKYIKAKIPIEHFCKKHNIYWNAIPSNILKGCGCPECSKEKIGNKNRKTHEQYINELKIINPNIKVIGVYIDALTPILHRCKACGYKWMARPGNILSGKGCPKCANILKKTPDEYRKKMSIINPNIEVIGDYDGVNIPIIHKCKIHNIEWLTTPASTLQGCGCPQCSKEKIGSKLRKTHQQYIDELSNVNPNIIAIENYIDALTPILHRCLICNNEWYATPANVLYGYGCPQCHESKGERRIRLWLEKNNIDYIYQHKYENCKDINPLPFDFYLPTYNILIEYDGIQHFESIDFFGGQEYFEYIQKHDATKNEYCKNNGIPLLRIPYFKYDNIEEELNSFLFI